MFSTTLCLASTSHDATSTAPAAPKVYLTTASGELAVNVEVVATEAKIERGLMFRQHLPTDAGMLFLYDPPQPITMWMRNTILSLDMIFIGTDGRVHRIESHTEPFSTDIISSDGTVQGVRLAEPPLREDADVLHHEPRIARRDLLGEGSRPIPRPVVHEDHLEVGIVLAEEALERPSDVLLLVARGHDHAQPGVALRLGGFEVAEPAESEARAQRLGVDGDRRRGAETSPKDRYFHRFPLEPP